MARRLFNIISAASLVVALALVALWVSGYWYRQALVWDNFGRTTNRGFLRAYAVGVSRGSFFAGRADLTMELYETPSVFGVHYIARVESVPADLGSLVRFGIASNPLESLGFAPAWAPLAITLVLPVLSLRRARRAQA